VAISDIVSGMFAAQGIAMALIARERSGRGQLVDIGMLDATTALLTYQAAICFATGTPPMRMGNRHPTIVPYETFAVADGEIVIAVGNDHQWIRFCEVIGATALADARFATNRLRVENYRALRPVLSEILARRTRDEWLREFKNAGVPCGAVRDIAEVLKDPQIAAREMVASIDHAALGTLRVLGVPVKLSRNAGSVRSAPPTLGQHTDRVLGDLGFTSAEIQKLRDTSTI
jgi:crotonobetainyl-CoA:carnitine CoA-transferase CaiB-like acyl-CoA transferase